MEDESIDVETLEKLNEVMLTEFPVFAMNEDYILALSIIINQKLEAISSALQKYDEYIQIPEPEEPLSFS